MPALFRAAAVARQQQRLEGALILSRPLPLWWLSLLLLIGSSAALLWLALGDYQHKVSVVGTLEPDTGIVELPAPQSGILAGLLVAQGQQVAVDQPLFVIENAHVLETGLPAESGSLAALQQQAARLQQQIALEHAQQQQWRLSQVERLASSDAVIERWQQTLQRQQQLLTLRQKQTERAEQLLAKGVLSAADRETLVAQVLNQQQAVADADLQLQTALSAKNALIRDHATQLLRSHQQIEQWSAQLQQNRQLQLQQQAEYRRVVTAPVAGTVSAVKARAGMVLRQQQSVLDLVPSAANLQVELQVPSQAMGFTKAGQRMTLRLDAFPYQKFGVQKATLVTIAGTLEMPERPGPEGMQPYYRLIATPDKQTVTAYGEEVPLRPGMRLMADIAVDKRSLLEWLLEPLYSLKGY